MALLPKASASLNEAGGGIGISTDLVCVLSTSSSGTAGQLGLYSNINDVVAQFGSGEGVDFAAHYIKALGKPVLMGRMNASVSATTGPLDLSLVAGTSVISFTGTPLDDEAIVLNVVAGGTIGVAGITFRYSRDQGNTWSGVINLGTATTFAIPGTGMTANFAAGTLIGQTSTSSTKPYQQTGGDTAILYCDSPKWNSTDLTACFTALKAGNILPRIVLVCGEVSDATHLQNCIDAINDYETSASRASHVICSFRDRYHPAVAQVGTTQTIAVAAGPPGTYTRSAGSWITDGFQVGMTATFAGFTNAANNGSHVISAVSATVLTTLDTLVVEVAATGRSASAVETKPTWSAALDAVLGTTPATLKISHRTMFTGGRARRTNPNNGWRKRRPSAWAIVMQEMAHDVQVSPSEWGLYLGGCPGWTITDVFGQLEEYDERVDGGLLQRRVAGLTTVDTLAGCYVSLPVTLDTEAAPLSRLPVGLVGDILFTVVKVETTLKLGQRIVLNDDGTPKESECQRIERYIRSRLSAALLTPGREGQRASNVSYTFPRNVNLLTPGTVVPCASGYTPLGYLEQIITTINVALPGG